MIEDVEEMDKHTGYKIVEDKIAYLHRDQYITNMTKRYLTQFAYLKECKGE